MAALRSRLLQRFWDAHSRGWDEMRSAPDSRAHVAAVVEMLTARLPPAGAVVDLGCGAGHYAVELAARGCRVIGLDSSSAMLALARENAATAGVTIELRQSDINKPLPIEVESVDAAILVSVLMVADDPARLLADVHRRLRPGGVLLVESVRKWGALSHGKQLGVRDRLVNGAKKTVVKIPGLVTLYQPDDIAALCRSAGLEIAEQKTYAPTFVVVAKKS